MVDVPIVPAPARAHALPGDGARVSTDTVIVVETDAVGTQGAALELAQLLHVRTELRLGIRTGAVQPAPDGTAASSIHVAIAPDLRQDAQAASPAAEGYRLTAGHEGIRVTGTDQAGLFYGIHSLVQLIRRGAEGWEVPAVEVADAPRFAYRGVMLDVARHFFDVATVCGFIDRAASLKFNVLHLHLSDDQGWRVHLDSRPALSASASGTAIGGDAGGCYSAEEYAEIIAHAASRHMTVVPEIDGPGHTHAVGLAYPELVEPPVVSAEVADAVARFGGGMPERGVAYTGLAVGFSSLRIGAPETAAFVRDVFTELAARTPGRYVHVGGDEALGTDATDYAAYVGETTALVASLGKTPIVWHEAGGAGGLAPGTVGQFWGLAADPGEASVKARALVAAGGQLILSPADAVYLDMKPTADFPLGLTWADGATSLTRAYEWDPAAVIDGVGEHAILGVEAPLWTETVRTATDIDALAFPRIAAAAEAAWSMPERKDLAGFQRRLGRLAPLWERAGIAFWRAPEIAWARDDMPQDAS